MTNYPHKFYQELPLKQLFGIYNRQGNSTGGSFHIVLEDYNIEDTYVYYCAEYALEHNDLVGTMIASYLIDMTEDQREEACELWRMIRDGY